MLRKYSDSSIPPSLRGPMLVDSMGLPRFWVTVWTLYASADLALSTESKKLRYIESLYVFADSLHGPSYLDDVLGHCDVEKLGTILEAYFVSLKNRSKATEATQKQWQAGFSFVKDVVRLLNHSNAAIGTLAKVETKLLHLDAMYGQLRIQKTRRPDILRSLPAEVASHLYEMLDPDSKNNPFTRGCTRWTVFLSFVIMLHQGLRRGELLLLPVDAVKSGFDNKRQQTKYWMNILKSDDADELDPRYNRPSIKTADSIRQVPVSELTANLIQTYTENYRGKPNHPFLLNTQWNTPLSHESLSAYFTKLSSHLPASVLKVLSDRTGKTSISPHDLRHTCAVVRLNQLLTKETPMDVALQKLRTFFGWSRSSDMPRKYARAVFEDRLANVWSNILDDRIEILRAIPRRL